MWFKIKQIQNFMVGVVVGGVYIGGMMQVALKVQAGKEDGPDYREQVLQRNKALQAEGSP